MNLDTVRLVLRGVLPPPIVAFLDALAATLRDLLQGETLRVVAYGGAIVVYLVTHLLNVVWPGHIRVVDVDTAIALGTTAAGVVAEVGRRWVWSPATVSQLQAEHAEDLELAARAAINAMATNTTSSATPKVTVAVALPDGEGPVDETAKGAPLPEGDGVELEPDEDLPAPDGAA